MLTKKSENRNCRKDFVLHSVSHSTRKIISGKKYMIQSDCNLVPNALKPILTAIETRKINKHIGGDTLTIGWNDYPFVLSTLSCLRHSMLSSVGPLWNTQRRPWVWADLKALRTVCDVFLFFCHFPIRYSGSRVVLIISIPDICLLSYFLY